MNESKAKATPIVPMNTRLSRAGALRAAAGAGAPPRRGVALLMVLIALGVAGAVTTFYLSSRDNSAAIGANAETTAQSSWAADSGAQVALAILETDADWLAVAADGALVDGMTIGAAEVSVLVTNLLGAPPTADDRDLVVTSVAVVNGVSSVSQKLVTLRSDRSAAGAVDPELGEFALFAGGGLLIEGDTLVSVWPSSPRARAGAPVNVGLGFTSGGAATLGAGADIVASRLFVRSDATAGLKSLGASAHFIDSTQLPFTVPAAVPTLPASFSALSLGSAPSTLNGVGESRTLASARYSDIDVRNSAVLTLQGPADYSFRRLRIQNSAVLRIQGAVRVHLRDDFEVTSLSTVELADKNSSVVFYTADDLTVENSGIGVSRAVARDAARDRDEIPYSDPSKVRIQALGSSSGGKVGPLYDFDDKSFVIASIHAPTGGVIIRDDSTLFGRVTGGGVAVRSAGALLYDPALDAGAGFTDPYGPLYKEDGSPADGLVAAIAAYNPNSGLAALQAQIAAVVPAKPADEPAEILPGDPTPRIASRITVRNWPIEARNFEVSTPDPVDRLMGGSITTEATRLANANKAEAVVNGGELGESASESAKDEDKEGGLLSLVGKVLGKLL